MTGSRWTTILGADELAAHYALTASLDPAFARQSRDFYESRTEAQLEAMAAGAWIANDVDGWQLARSWRAKRFGWEPRKSAA